MQMNSDMTAPFSERVSSGVLPVERTPALLPRTNHLLALLSESERRRLAPFAKFVRVPRGTVLYEIGDEVRHAYFPVSGMISLHAMTMDGALVQVAAIERNGFVGVPAVLDDGVTPYRTAATLGSDGYRMSITTLAEVFRRNASFQSSILRFAHRQATQIGDAAICHYVHTIRQRLCRWLLVCGDCARSETIELTQDRLAEMLGVPRQSVSRAAATLQDRGLIQQRHGRVRILNRQGLTECACECYDSGRSSVGANESRN
jgi:CRP-like cAMP-binding protein